MATKKTKKKSAKKAATTKQRQHAKAVAAADQENARLRDERKAAKDGMIASERALAESAKKAPAKQAPTKKNGAKRKSLVDSALVVLGSAKEPLTCGEMIERIQAAKLWNGDGKTPQNTLYSAILREIQTKGKDARFVKTARGSFERRKGVA